MTIHGGLSRGLLGPVFLLAPLALLSLKTAHGTRLLAAAVIFALVWPANVDTRFLIPAAPFLALALGLALAPVRWAIPLVLLGARVCIVAHGRAAVLRSAGHARAALSAEGGAAHRAGRGDADIPAARLSRSRACSTVWFAGKRPRLRRSARRPRAYTSREVLV